jgi:C4-type Zn-finger protein
MGSASCPNCGHNLVILREEHQPAGTQRVWLRWLMCSSCRHVALEDWGFVPADDAEPVMEGASHGEPDTAR